MIVKNLVKWMRGYLNTNISIVVMGMLLSYASVESGFTQSPSSVNHPNIVYILTDDLGYGDVECNNSLSRIPTPNINQLAREGIRFTNGHSPAQICTPSRYSILTGCYYWRSERYKEIGWRVIQPWQKPLIEEGRLTLPTMLKQKGYHTACIGKWHLGFDWKVREGMEKGSNYKNLDYTARVDGGPITRGFDYFFGLDVPNGSVVFIENDRFTEVPAREPYNSIVARWGDKTAQNWTFEGILPTLTKKAIEYIEDQANNKEPFFLYYAMTGPHTPIAPDSSFLGSSGAGRYGDFVHQIDDDLGRIVETLKKEGVYESTVIVFSSDNGSPERDGTDYYGDLKSVLRFGHYPNSPYRGMKADLWEGGHRVPFIIRWPGLVIPNTTSDVTVSQLDIMRTLAEFMEIELPVYAAEDSYNILPVLRGTSKQGHDPLILYNGDKPTIRSGKWKLILDKGPTGFSRHAGYNPPPEAPVGQLYNIQEDAQEIENLYNERSEVVSRMVDILERYRKNGSHSLKTRSK